MENAVILGRAWNFFARFRQFRIQLNEGFVKSPLKLLKAGKAFARSIRRLCLGCEAIF
jgi:hypothetical protein